MKKTSLILLVLLATACTNHSKKEIENGVERNVVNVSMTSLFDINTTVVDKNDTIKIRFKNNHEKQLAVRGPEGKFYFLAISPKEQMNALYSSEEFVDMNVVEVKVADLHLVPYQYQKVNKERVFAKKGKYQFLLSDNLQSEDGAKMREVEFLGR